MKKVLPVIICVFILCLLVISFFVGNRDNDSSVLSNDSMVIYNNAVAESKKIKDSERRDFTYISLDQYFELFSENELRLVFLGKEDCEYTAIAIPIVQNIMRDYGIEIFYLNVDDFNDDGLERFLESSEYLENGFGTPMLFLIRNNSILDVVDELTDREHYLKFFRLHGYVL